MENLCLHCGEDLNHSSQIYIHECTRWILGAPKQLKPKKVSKMRARVIQNTVIFGTHYLGFVTEGAETRESFSYNPVGGGFRFSKLGKPKLLNSKQTEMLKSIQELVGLPDEPSFYHSLHNSFAGQVIDLPSELLEDA